MNVREWIDKSADQSDQRNPSPYIPGIQVTYPWMAKSPSGKIWLSFRECANCSTGTFDTICFHNKPF